MTMWQRKLLYAADGKTVQEIDYLYGGRLIEAEQYDQGRIQSATHYLPNGTTTDEVDSYHYTNGNLDSVTTRLPLALQQQIVTYAPDGSIQGITQSQFDATGAVIGTAKYSGTGYLLEIDHFNAGTLANIQYFTPQGQLGSTVTYGQDGQSITEVDTYQYSPTTLALSSLSKADGQGHVFETDLFHYGPLGFLSQVSKLDASGQVTEIDQYDYFGRLTGITHPSATTAPSANGDAAWNSASGFGEVDVFKAMSAVLGRTPSDVALPASAQQQWDLGALHFQDAWAAGLTGKGVIIADIDTGIDLHNADLTQNLSPYDWNFIANNANVQDDNGHGTCTAAEMCAANDGQGITGAAYDAQLMVLKALDARGGGQDTHIVSAIDYAVAHGANVINLSLAGNHYDTALQAALQNASDHGVIVCIAAGNDGASYPSIPAAYAQTTANCIAVGATQQAANGFELTSFSNQAGSASAYNFVDAPGAVINSYGLNGHLQNWFGTSMAAPLVAAEAADLLSAHSSLSVEQLTQDIVHATVGLVGIAP